MGTDSLELPPSQPTPLRWNNFLLTFFGVKTEINHYLCVQVKVKTKALSLVYLNPDHQALIDRIMGLHEGGLNSGQIAALLNQEGVTSWTGKQFYPELVFGVIRKARLRLKSANTIEMVGFHIKLEWIAKVLAVWKNFPVLTRIEIQSIKEPSGHVD